VKGCTSPGGVTGTVSIVTPFFTTASVADNGSKFKAVNNRDKNFTWAKVERRRAQLEEMATPASLLNAEDNEKSFANVSEVAGNSRIKM